MMGFWMILVDSGSAISSKQKENGRTHPLLKSRDLGSWWLFPPLVLQGVVTFVFPTMWRLPVFFSPGKICFEASRCGGSDWEDVPPMMRASHSILVHQLKPWHWGESWWWEVAGEQKLRPQSLQCSHDMPSYVPLLFQTSLDMLRLSGVPGSNCSFKISGSPMRWLFILLCHVCRRCLQSMWYSRTTYKIKARILKSILLMEEIMHHLGELKLETL